MGHTLTWEKGRQLKSFDSNTYTYNANGIRTSKTVNGVKHDYILDGTKILREGWNYDEDTETYKDILIPIYDNEESVCGIIYNDVPYYFQKNLQGDVIGITNEHGTVVGAYRYDAWGAIAGIITCTELTDGVEIADINPFRYRSYYFDKEIEMYYLQSRYYDPQLGRFINADKCFAWDVEKSVFTANIYQYCNNDPVNEVDENGKLVLKIILRAIIGAIFGAAMQYLADVLQNLLDCALDNKRIYKNVWRARSGLGDYISAIVTGACDATLQIGVWKSIGISTAATIIGHLVNWARGRGFSYQQLMKDLVWNALLSIVSNAVCKKFTPKRGKKFNKYIRERYKVKGSNAYKRHWDSLRECVEWNGFVISSFINTLRSASRRILDFVETTLMDCLITALAKAFGG